MKAEQRLCAKKEKLWQQKDPTKWEIKSGDQSSREDLIKDKSLAFQKMLPNVFSLRLIIGNRSPRQVTRNLWIFSNQCRIETERISRDNFKIIRDHLQSVAQKQSNQMTTVL